MDIFVMDRKLVCAVQLPDRCEQVARWGVYDLDNNKLSWGYSQGMGKSGAGCIPMAMTNAKRAARRILKQEKKG
jgi:hypothetical protein